MIFSKPVSRYTNTSQSFSLILRPSTSTNVLTILSQNIPFEQFLISVTPLWPSIIAFKTVFFASFFIHPYLFLFSSALFLDIVLCSFISLNICSFAYRTPPCIPFPFPTHFVTHISSHAIITRYLRYLHEFGTPPSCNYFTFLSNRFLIFTSFSMHLSIYVSLYVTLSQLTLCIYYLYPQPLGMLNLTWFSECHLPVFHTLKPCI